MRRDGLELAKLSLQGLLEADRLEAAARLLEAQLEAAQTHRQAEAALGLFEGLPAGFAGRPGVQRLYLQALCRARRPAEVLAWFEGRQGPADLGVYRGWALVRTDRPAEALALLEGLEPGPTLDWGLFHRGRGEALYWLGREGWQAALEAARPHLRGAALGRMLIDQGAFLNASGQRGAARVCWAEALGQLEHDPYYLAWAHNSLGLSLLNDRPQEAERHLLAAVRASRRAGARAFRCKALSGLGAVRRGLGEWERALHSYQQAYRAPGDGKDRLLALWGWGHTLRLMGRAEEALAKLTQALRLKPDERWLEADIGAAQLMLGEAGRARQSLERAAPLGERGQVVRRVAEAEMARRRGEIGAARAGLAGLEAGSLWAREELACFPQLAALAGPRPPAGAGACRVVVNPYGLLEVRVNGRAVPLSPTGKAGELLVFLMLHGNTASLERLVDRLAPEKNRGKRKALWEHIKALRSALGWDGSVQSRQGGYVLDPEAEWVLLEEPLPLGSREFMEGHYSDWISERRPLVI